MGIGLRHCDLTTNAESTRCQQNGRILVNEHRLVRGKSKLETMVEK